MLGDEIAKGLVKVPLAELEAWDTEHDVLGNRIASGDRSSKVESDGDESAVTGEKKSV